MKFRGVPALPLLPAAPAGPQGGEVYVDDTLGRLRWHDGEGWHSAARTTDAGGGGNLVVSDTDPGLVSPGMWIQTFPNGDMTFWVEDGT